MRETRILEFKETITNIFLKTVSAFSNYNGGMILFGVDDDGNVKVDSAGKPLKVGDKVVTCMIFKDDPDIEMFDLNKKNVGGADGTFCSSARP